jgi:hypothetical protein
MARAVACLGGRVYAQLTIFDALEASEAEDELRLLGAGPELGEVLLMPLLARGWRLHRARPFAGGGDTLFILANEVFEVKREGGTLADVAVGLFEEAVRLSGTAS